MKQDARSVLKLEKLVFDKLLFERKGFSSENNFEFNMESQISKRSNEEIYKVTLILHGKNLMNILWKLVLQDSFLLGQILRFQMKIRKS